jgi:DNA-binding protein HU-beta
MFSAFGRGRNAQVMRVDAQYAAMNKRELSKAVAVHSDVDFKTVASVLDGFTDVVTAVVAQGERVVITGFAKFVKVNRAARIGRNPATGETIQIKASKKARITPVKAFKDAVMTPSTAPRLKRGAFPINDEAVRAAGKTIVAAVKRAAKPAAKRAAAKKAAPKRRATAKAAPKRRTTARKTTAKRATARKAAPARRRTAAKAAPRRRTVAKAAPARRKTTARKTTAARKPAARKPAARRTAKRAASRRR